MNKNMLLTNRTLSKQNHASQADSMASEIQSFNLFKRHSFAKVVFVLSTLALTSCASTGSGYSSTASNPKPGEKYQIPNSFLNGELNQGDKRKDESNGNGPENLDGVQEQTEVGNHQTLKPISREAQPFSIKTLDSQFSDKASLTVTVNDMAMKSFLNYTLGELLGLDYVVGKGVSDEKVTLNVGNQVTPRKLFSLVSQVLSQNGIGLRENDKVYYVYQLPKGNKSSVVMGFGRYAKDVPVGAGQVLQMVPLKYGVRDSVFRTLSGLVDAQITRDYAQSALFIRGEREQVVRALELTQLLDIPSNRGKHIAMVFPVFISVDDFIKTVTELLKSEGVEIAQNASGNGSVLFVPLSQLGALTVFSSEEHLVKRVQYWAKQIDKPSLGTERQYHIYTPRFARAKDLGESIGPLITGSSSASDSASSGKALKESSEVASSTTKSRTSVSSNDKMTLVVDERSNNLIFYSSGSEYQSILPLVRRMDILPKQVLLNVTIAEVTLTGEFKRGFEFALTSGNFTSSSKGSLGLSDITGVSLGWKSGVNEVIGKFIDGNSQVNVLSKPSILVRDGTDANINVGSKIPVSGGSTTSESGNVVTENISYQETGVKLSVTPTVNAQGVVILNINQSISNQVAGQVGKGDNPIFFERSLKTEVVAESGQTILLGGLISENSSDSNKGVPFLKSIPLLGSLFESESKTNDKTELVIMMTPKIVERSGQWNNILNQLQSAMDSVDFTKAR